MLALSRQDTDAERDTSERLPSHFGEASIIMPQRSGQTMVRRKESHARDLLRFFVRSGRLKTERRRGWIKKLGLSDAESVADHSYRTALMTMVISDSRGLDTGKALRLALLHDLPEAIAGDAMPEERSGKLKTTIETRAMQELLKDVSPEVRPLYREAWLEFVSGRTEEAKLVRQLDKLEMAIQAWEYAKGSDSPTLTREFWATARAHVTDEGLLELLRLVEA
jgi:putative hydrolases of HD superfamily